ncbi:zinc ribbon domain-containing protein [Methanobrevibacter sp.]|uniref:zinc ribbon domain-containing protein n=1 Tax=Methanobrevibacter sp. TaxID=66852 RepID=UPI0025E30AEF|nr:zinc ribbon domain-containing protein [Methanobrevibacter sp.]MBQ2665458.1 zinc ribbon domain-containing protein [Methanobrevibacter sp.]
MKCSKCGFENKDEAKFCTKCGNPFNEQNSGDSAKSDNSKYIIIALVIVILLLVGTIGYFMLNSNSSEPVQSSDNSHNSIDSDSVQSNAQEAESSDDSDSQKTTTAVSSSKSASKEWVSIGSYSGSGSGSQSIRVPEGTIKVELSAYPIKNYATNHLYVSGSNDVSGGVDWGSKSDVETRYDSFTYTSSSEEVFTIDYYETVSWNVEFYRYQ